MFRNPDVVINGDDGDTVFPQVLLTNSHDGKNAFTFTAGLFRMVCANGLVVSTKEFENVKMRHMGYTFEDLHYLHFSMSSGGSPRVLPEGSCRGLSLNENARSH